MKFPKCNPDAIPPRLREIGHFCLWKNENGRKIPYNPRTEGKAQPNNPDTFSSFTTAAAGAGAGYTGMGIGIFGSLAAIDIDHCITDGQLSPMAAEIVKIMDSYTERSPSGDGVHILFMAPGLKYDTSRYFVKNSGSGLEIYIAGMTSRYMTITGDRINGADVEERAAAVQEVVRRYMERPQAERERAEPPARTGAGLSLSDSDIIARARMAKNGRAFSALWDGDISGYPSHSEADQVLCNILAFWTGGDEDQIDRLFRESGLMRDKWELIKYRDRTISAAIARCETYYTPTARQEPETRKAHDTQYTQIAPEKPQEGAGAKEVNQVNTDTTPAEKPTSSPTEATEKPQRRTSVELFDSFMAKVQTEAYRPIRTGMDSFDRLLGGGFDPQSLVMIGAAPGMGKTSLTQQVFETMARNGERSGQDVIFLNFEMSREQLLARSISRAAAQAGHKITAAQIMRGYAWTPEQRAFIMEAAGKYRARVAPRMHYNPDGTAPTVEAVKGFLDEALKRAITEKKPAPVIVLDYLQLIQAEKKQDPQEAIKAAVKVLKDYAIAGNTVSCAILAFNRNSNAAGKVTMESGRDTSAIEYSADTLLGLNYRALENGNGSMSAIDELQKGVNGIRELRLKLLKKRMSDAGGYLELNFDGGSSTFIPVETELETEKAFGRIETVM